MPVFRSNNAQIIFSGSPRGVLWRGINTAQIRCQAKTVSALFFRISTSTNKYVFLPSFALAVGGWPRAGCLWLCGGAEFSFPVFGLAWLTFFLPVSAPAAKPEQPFKLLSCIIFAWDEKKAGFFLPLAWVLTHSAASDAVGQLLDG